MKYLVRAATVLLVLAFIGGIWFWWRAEIFLNTPPERHGADVYFDVPEGATMTQIARDLAQKGLITDARKFVWLARWKDKSKQAQAGRFLLNTGWKPAHILDALVNGMPALYRVTIPEGLTWWQTARLLEAAGIARYKDFEAVIRDPDFLRHYGIPFESAEGFLMPDTYLLKKPESAMPPTDFAPASEEEKKLEQQWQAQAKSVAGRMVDNFWRKTASLWPRDDDLGQIGGLPMPARDKLKKWVTMASIIEEETGVPAERARVAGVYENRLARKMLLQADPTVMYGLGPDFVGRLKKVHLEDPTNAYNTYYYPGMPPGPIASFGSAALKAAIRPEKHDYLFFVATGVGDTHTFSKNFEDHSAAVREYRKTRQGK